MRKMMILSLVVVILLSVGFALAQQAISPIVTIVKAGDETNLSLALAAPFDYTRDRDHYWQPEAPKTALAELSAQGLVNIDTTQHHDFMCGMSPELRELSAQGLVTVQPSNLFCTT